MTAFFTLLSSLISFYGIGEIYQGKTSEKNTQVTKGIALFGLGTFGISFFNPMFSSFILSLLVTIGFTGLSLGMISWIFLHTHPETYVFNAEIQDKISNQEKREELKTIEQSSSLPIPVTFKEKAMAFLKRNSATHD